MTTNARALGPAFQLGHVVRDIEAAMRHWVQALGVGPFVYMENPGELEFTYRGQATSPRSSIAFSYSGEMQIELIQQRNDAPSPYVDFLASGREGLQHLAFYTDDMALACNQLEQNSLVQVYVMAPVGSDERIYYYEDPAQPAAMVEVITLTPLRKRVHAAIRAATRDWTGDDPIRRFRTIPEFAERVGAL
jgi:hypothetical protein